MTRPADLARAQLAATRASTPPPHRAPPPAAIPARPTIYKGIPMRSRLEAGYASWLDTVGFTWEYEPLCFADEHGQYLPDFLIHGVQVLTGRHDLYVEIKPRTDDELLEYLFAQARRLLPPNARFVVESEDLARRERGAVIAAPDRLFRWMYAGAPQPTLTWDHGPKPWPTNWWQR